MNKKFVLRFVISIFLGIIFGLVCVTLASGTNPDIWGTPLMWSILYNRFLLGIVVAVVGVHTFHPLFGFRMWPFLRGALFGILVSMDLAIGVFINATPDAMTIFWYTILAGAIYGMIIDIVTTKIAGEGTEILGKK